MDIGRIDRLNFPSTHALYGTGPPPHQADVLLLLECVAPWISPGTAPPPSAKIAWVDPDPVLSRYKTMEFSADLWLPVSAAAAARAIYEAATAMLSKTDMNRIADRRSRLEQRKQEVVASAQRRAEELGARRPLHPLRVGYELGKILEPDTILLDDALSNSAHVRAYHRRDLPGTYFQTGGSAGGWGAGAAFGAKLSKPESDVVLATGDGYFMYGTPLVALWAAAHYKAAFLSVVFVNRSYSTGTVGLKSTYPEGAAVEAGNYEGGMFDPPPDFAKLAEAANGYGETVREPEEVGPALRRALEQVRRGTPAVVAAYLPTLVEEMNLAAGDGRP
jgi:acetolactate synthase-1/2/3 large subunit